MNDFINNFSRYLPWFWVAITIVCVVIESLTFSLTTIWFAAGAFIVIFLALTPLPFVWQILIFVIISFALLIFTRPFLVKHLKINKQTPTNVDGIIGKHVRCTAKITSLDKGTVKLNGVEWSAIGADNIEIAEGTECEIVAVQGVTVTVKPVNN